MAFDTVPTAVTGGIVAAAWGNRVRDNDDYLKGRAGEVAIENALSATGLIASPVGFRSGPGAGNQYTFQDRVDGTTWVIYASGGWSWWYSGALGGLLGFNYATGNMNWPSGANDRDTGIPPGRLRRVTRMGMRGSGGGTHTLNYLADGKLDWIHFPDGIDATSTLTFHYNADGTLQTIWLRDGGSGGTGIASVGFTYSGGRVVTIGEG